MRSNEYISQEIESTNFTILYICARVFLPSFYTNLALISMFCTTDGPARILPPFLSFYFPPLQVFMLEHVATGIVRESACGGGTQEDRSTKIFGRVRVWTQATCMVGERFIHCAMPSVLKFELSLNRTINFSLWLKTTRSRDPNLHLNSSASYNEGPMCTL